MFIRIGIRKIRNTDDFLGSGTKLLLPSLSLGFSTRGERVKIFLCWPFVHRQLSTHWLNQRACAPAVHKPRSEKINSLRLSPNLNSLILFKIPMNHFWSNVIHIPSHFSICFFFYCDICDCHILPACVWIPALNVCT